MTPPPEQPEILALFTMIFGVTVVDEPDFGSAGLNVAVPDVFVHVVPPAAPAPVAAVATIPAGTTSAAAIRNLIEPRIDRTPSPGPCSAGPTPMTAR